MTKTLSKLLPLLCSIALVLATNGYAFEKSQNTETCADYSVVVGLSDFDQSDSLQPDLDFIHQTFDFVSNPVVNGFEHSYVDGISAISSRLYAIRAPPVLSLI